MNTVCHKFGKSAISQDLDLSDLLWKLNQVNSSAVKWPILFLAILSFCILSIPVLYFKMTKLIFNYGFLLKLRGTTLCLSVGRYAQPTTKGTNEYSFNFAKSRRCSTNISIPFVREFIHLFYVIQVSTHSEDECPLSIISCPCAHMSCQTKVKKNKVVDV